MVVRLPHAVAAATFGLLALAGGAARADTITGKFAGVFLGGYATQGWMAPLGASLNGVSFIETITYDVGTQTIVDANSATGTTDLGVETITITTAANTLLFSGTAGIYDEGAYVSGTSQAEFATTDSAVTGPDKAFTYLNSSSLYSGALLQNPSGIQLYIDGAIGAAYHSELLLKDASGNTEDYYFAVTADVTTPEPASFAVMGVGLLALGWLRRRRAGAAA